MMQIKHAQKEFDIRSLIKTAPAYTINQYTIFDAFPATGILYVTDDTKYFVSGHVRLRGMKHGEYPYKYLDMINELFGNTEYRNTIEVCSGSIDDVFTVDINPEKKPDLLADGQTFHELDVMKYGPKFERWRCDPPYNKKTAKGMYNTKRPMTPKLLTAGARVCKPGALMFLLLGPTNYQWCPKGVMRIGLIFITVVPNNEVRCLNIYYKYE